MFKSLLPYFKRKLSVSDLVILALFVALSYVLGTIDIYVTPSFKLFTLDFLPNAMGAALFGPLWGGVMGIATDIVAYFANPMGGFFPGWMISQMVSNIIYGLFLYKRPAYMAIPAHLLVKIIVTFGLDKLWLSLMYGTPAGELYTSAKLINNLIQFPIQVFLIIVFVKLARTAYSKVFVK